MCVYLSVFDSCDLGCESESDCVLLLQTTWNYYLKPNLQCLNSVSFQFEECENLSTLSYTDQGWLVGWSKSNVVSL